MQGRRSASGGIRTSGFNFRLKRFLYFSRRVSQLVAAHTSTYSGGMLQTSCVICKGKSDKRLVKPLTIAIVSPVLSYGCQRHVEALLWK